MAIKALQNILDQCWKWTALPSLKSLADVPHIHDAYTVLQATRAC